MSYQNENELQSNGRNSKPPVTSYDSGHEHSVEHWMEVQRMVEEEDKPRAFAAKA